MPRCPYCEEEIDYLIETRRKEEINHYTLRGRQNISEDYTDDEEYQCPECKSTLTSADYEADEFLSGDWEEEEKEEKENVPNEWI